VPRQQGARPNRKPKGNGEWRCHGIKSPVFEGPLTVRPPLRTDHGTASPVAGIKKNNPKANQSQFPQNTARHNGLRITCSPDCNAETYQVARQPGAVKSKRDRRATAPGGNNPAEYKAAKCMRLLCGAFGRHDEINFTIKDMQQRYLLCQALTSVRGI
jgi:hypothetical protein